MVDKISFEIKNFLIEKFASKNDFDNLCRKLDILNIYRGNYADCITDLINDIERDLKNHINLLYNVLIELKPNFRDKIDFLFEIKDFNKEIDEIDNKEKKKVAILFSDLKGFSQIKTDELKEKLSKIIYDQKEEIRQNKDCLYINTWGDAFFIVFSNTESLLKEAIILKKFYRDYNWEKEGFNDINIRIALHYGEITLFIKNDKIINLTGKNIDLSARIEPIVNPNYIFCSEAFYKDVNSKTEIEFYSLGKIELAKNYKKEELYSVGEKATLERQVKILAITAAPNNDIYYELEQDTIITSFCGIPIEKLLIDIPDPIFATMSEIENWGKDYKYDIIIISCHGSNDGHLLFEDENGNNMRINGKEIADKFNQFNINPKILILSSCYSGFIEKKSDNNLSSVAEEIFNNSNIPCVIGMNKEITNLASIDFNKGFLKAIFDGKNILDAFESGKIEINNGETQRIQDKGDNWRIFNEKNIPILFVKDNELNINNFYPDKISRERVSSMDFKNAKYLERGFIGRRKELRNILKMSLIDKNGVIIIKGAGGVGKSTITTRVCANLRQKDYIVIDFIGVLELSTIIERLIKDVIEKYQLKIDINQLKNSNESDKIDFIIKYLLLNNKIAIIFDNFEDNQEVDTGKIKNDYVKLFIERCKKSLVNHDSILFITTRYDVLMDNQPIEISEFKDKEYYKLLLNQNTLNRLEVKEKIQLKNKIGGNPRIIELLESLSNIKFKNEQYNYHNLQNIIDKAISIVIGDKKHERYDFTPWFINNLIGYLNENEKQLLKAVSIYRNPTNLVGLEIFGIKNIEDNAQLLLQLSLIEYIPIDKYYSQRLTVDFVTNPENKLFNIEELRDWHRKAAEYVENIDSIEAIYQYKEANEYDKAFLIADTVQNWFYNHGYVYEAREILEDFIDKNIKLNDKNTGYLYHSIGIIEQKQGEIDKALDYYNKSLKISQEIGYKLGISYSYGQIGNIYYQKGEYEESIKFYNKSLKISQEIGYKLGISASYHNIGIIEQKRGEINKALDYYYKSLKIKEEIGDKSGISGSYHNIGAIYQQKGEYKKAIEFYNKSLKIKEEIGDINGIALSNGQFGLLYIQLKDYQKAFPYLIKAYLIFKKLESPNIKLAINQLIQIKDYIPQEQFIKKLEESGIKIEEMFRFIL
ncbi:MAG: hypothetical protein A2086_02270 [Spirochaetes bacterium GWD1_27_9]|nr:MAG: hypothetical protein A2Z98_10090 [Spirochaetes bacterium GWB1_27_13]OHD22144.1 MAG: hypothetical protein A2Y34_14835 [Spirochaetes bacterium GWC1_27_15]OHD29263.1 MAG: hypothetical protein A2086_02270 [Spirochaetes bacterium GWD1_27_9]